MTGRQRGRRPWLLGLEDALHELGGTEWSERLIESLFDLLREPRPGRRRMAAVTASRIATRGARLALLLLEGMEQSAAARVLGVSNRTAEYDAARLRQVDASGALSWAIVARRRARRAA